MKIFLAAVLLSQAFFAQAAKIVYVTDHFEVPLYGGKDDRFKVLSNLETGTPLTLIKTDKGDGWTQVKTAEKKTGWIASRYLTELPIARVQLDAQIQGMEALERESRELREESSTINSKVQETVAENEQLIKEKNRLAQEVAAIRKASSETVKIMEERDHL
ncbi:MAG: TIGR04211 family SH3 domain-containing protein, partial [Methylococcales bacterium]